MFNRIWKEIKRFVMHFLVLIIFILVFLMLFIIRYIRCSNKIEHGYDYMYDSPNKERVYGDQRVFDYGDMLTDEQEASLEAYIHEKERITVSDIVIVTLNESLADFAEENKPLDMEIVPPDKYIRIYADEFWERNHFGYDQAQVLDGTTATGDGVILVDNVFREPETGKVYTWMCTTGKCEDRFSEYMIDTCLDSFYAMIENDYYQSCINFIDEFVYWMKPYQYQLPVFFHIVPLIIAIFIFIGYVSVKREYGKQGSAVTFATYLVGDPTMNMMKEDKLIRTDTTRTVHVSYSSSSGSGHSGGGGHHVSRSGGSHGGGGRSR